MNIENKTWVLFRIQCACNGPISTGVVAKHRQVILGVHILIQTDLHFLVNDCNIMNCSFGAIRGAGFRACWSSRSFCPACVCVC